MSTTAGCITGLVISLIGTIWIYLDRSNKKDRNINAASQWALLVFCFGIPVIVVYLITRKADTPETGASAEAPRQLPQKTAEPMDAFPAAQTSSKVEQLKEIAKMQEIGILTKEEFEREKKKILSEE